MTIMNVFSLLLKDLKNMNEQIEMKKCVKD